MPRAHVNSQDLYYEDGGGDGPAVILSHGFLMDHEMFAPQMEALAPDWRVITWDARGFGETVFDGQPFDYWDSARDCLGLLDHLGVEQAVLGGMSQGGFVSLRAALLQPQRVRGLILIDTQAGPEDPERAVGYRQMLDSWVADGPQDELAEVVAGLIVADPDENTRWIAKWRQWPQERLREPGNALLDRDDLTGRVHEITAPALVVHGTDDVAIEMDKARALCERLPDCRGLVEVEGAAHAPNLTHPTEVNPAITTFLAGL